MSGIAGIVRLDGRDIDERSLRSLTGALAFRGPDRQDVWSDGCVGFGHTLLRTSDDVIPHQQPATLDGSVWITADARIDGRAELVRQLGLAGTSLQTAEDALLILHAYHAWGERCVEKLLGDFSFAIWDTRTRRLFCARDHFGVKPFYYARTPSHFIFSNTLNVLRQAPDVSGALDELAVADFLLFGINQDPATTTFADIKRLPPAHTLTCRERQVDTNRYWSVPLDGSVRYRRSGEYVEHFRDLLHSAVADRLRSPRVSVWMSGGLDSTSMTAVAHQELSKASTGNALRAHTVVYDTLIPDRERSYACAAARALGVENHVFTADSHGPFERWDRIRPFLPEPIGDPFAEMRLRQLTDIAAHSRILLSGEGGDEVLWSSWAIDVARQMKVTEFAASFARALIVHRRRPALGIRAALSRRAGSPACPAYPSWMNPAFTSRLRLVDRWEQVHRAEPPGAHPLRPAAHWRLSSAPWSWYFESSDPGVTRIPLEIRYPFLDVRLVSYLLAIPPIPWCIDKQILRVAMRGTLPDLIRLRPKSPLGGDPLNAGLRACRELPFSACAPELASYVNLDAEPISTGEYNGNDPWLDVRPLCLSYWLEYARVHNPDEEMIGDETHQH
jgi:asparagine synthase (glutamine-hydrolysing)